MIDNSPIALELRNIDKRFGAVHANKSIDLQIAKASVHGIIGENGAGKSTLMSIIYGFYQADGGDILIDGEVVKIKDSQQAIELGVGMVHQHFMLVENQNALENIILGAESSRWLDQSKQAAVARLTAIRDRYGLDVDLETPVGDLPVGLQQRVEILKALYRDAKILILDEPTGVLTPQEADQLFEVLRTLREQGVAVIIVTHKLREIMDITDSVSVMRQGAMVAHRKTSQTNPAELAELMVGRPVLLKVNKPPQAAGDVKLTAKGICLAPELGTVGLHDVGLELRAGEILGVAGVSGNGQSQLLEVLAGTRRADAGELSLSGQRYTAKTYPSAAELRAKKVAHIPEDRLSQGLVPNFPLFESAVLGYQNDATLGDARALKPSCMVLRTKEIIERYDVRPGDPYQRSANLSGGNQQKLIIGREMMRQPDILLVGQPTRGVDIGAIEMIYQRIIEARSQGMAVLLVSVELDEIMSLSDRILVMCGGRVTGVVNAADTNAKALGLMMSAAAEADEPAAASPVPAAPVEELSA